MAISERRRKRRTRGTGSITKRQDGLWEGRLSLGWQDGRRKVISVYGRTKREAEERLADERRARKPSANRAPANLTVGRYLEDWRSAGCTGQRGTLRPHTLRRYEGVIRYQLIPHLGRIKLIELQPSDVERMLHRLREEGKATNTIVTVRSVLRSALSRAEINGLVVRNAAKLARPDSPPRAQPTVLTPDAVRKVLRACEPGMRRLVALSVDTGLRQSELLGLQWAAVDLEGRTLAVRTVLSRVRSRYTLGAPKSRTSYRPVPLSDRSVRLLREERRAQAWAREEAGSRWHEVIPDLVFTTAVGVPRNGAAVTHGLARTLRTAGLQHLQWHDLRAIHGGLLVQAGVGMATARDRLGHSRIGVTATFYSSVVDVLGREAADKVGRLLRGEGALGRAEPTGLKSACPFSAAPSAAPAPP
ncbi:MAG: tyrosine-type recombinase/integrase [Candidatus Dormibacteria bacterium]